ncbi:MAG: acyltransferase [Clostridia bacterium]|nr:acyltransferase [Clostridia bacterium]
MKQKKVYLEWLRILAVLLVIYNHLPAYIGYTTAAGLPRALLMFQAAVTRINVPLFLMVSGALLLNRREDYRLVLKKRVLRFALVLIVFSLGMAAGQAVYSRVKGLDFSLSPLGFLSGLLANSLWNTETYWFLYAYISFLLLLPLLQRIAAGFTRQDFYLLLGLQLLLSALLPAVNLFLSLAGQPALRLADSLVFPLSAVSAFFYPLMGCYLENAVDIRCMERERVLLLALLGAGAAALCCLFTYMEAAHAGVFTENYLGMFTALIALPAFLLIKRLTLVDWPALGRGRLGRTACALGALTFGVYLLDPYWKMLLWGSFSRALSPLLPPVPLSLCWVVLSAALGCGFTWLLKKLPGFRKLL